MTLLENIISMGLVLMMIVINSDSLQRISLQQQQLLQHLVFKQQWFNFQRIVSFCNQCKCPQDRWQEWMSVGKHLNSHYQATLETHDNVCVLTQSVMPYSLQHIIPLS